MEKYDVVIIGGGLGGLECGYILSRKGYHVCILEKNSQLGGCLQTFKRGGVAFDTGFHYVGGLDKGQPLHSLFEYFGLLELPWQRMDDCGFAEVVMKDRSFMLASGYERFVDTLSCHFPRQRQELMNYVAFLEKVEGTIKQKLFSDGSTDEFSESLFGRSAYSFLQETISDLLLRNVLAGASMTMDLYKDEIPLYVFAQINNSFIRSSWKLAGGGSLIAEKLADSIRRMGGTIVTRADVTELVEKDGKIISAVYNNGERAEGKYFISNVHPATTLALIPDSKCVRPIYRKRISALPNTPGAFTTHLKCKPGAVPYFNRNIFIYKNGDPWRCGSAPDSEVDKVMVHAHTAPERSAFTENIDILAPMLWSDVESWADTTVGKRGNEYLDFKNRKAEECIDLVTTHMPELKGNIENVYTSTPLTYRDYTGTWQGSAYGIRKNYNNVLMTLLTPQTPVENLLLTGQNLNLHGVLGVTMTSFFTCAKLLGMKELVRDLNF